MFCVVQARVVSSGRQFKHAVVGAAPELVYAAEPVQPGHVGIAVGTVVQKE